jgi:O-acetyl-ADP-ribose deacetylase (regulator of RNase III)
MESEGLEMTIRKTAKLSGNRRLILSIGNLLEVRVDDMVNAANGHVAHGGGVAAAISRAAGPELDRESREYVRAHGPVPTGSAAVTTAGRLPFQGVIHAVGPSMGCGDEEAKLTSAVSESLRLAHERGWTSLALPAISSGIFRVPLDVCARSYIRGILQHFQQHPDSTLKEVRIALFAGELVGLVEKEMGEIASP